MIGMRVRILREGKTGKGPVIYWMSRDQRAEDNWALLYAQEQAIARRLPLAVCFLLVPEFLEAQPTHFHFLRQGLLGTADNLRQYRIPFFLIEGRPDVELTNFLNIIKPALLVTDFDPLHEKISWKNTILKTTDVSVHEVDAHNIVPCWLASDKQEFAARTFRPKIKLKLTEFLGEFPPLRLHPYNDDQFDKVGSVPASKMQFTNSSVPFSLTSGSKAGRKQLADFILSRLRKYSEASNDPNQDVRSGLSPYLHFGQISAQRVALEMVKSPLDQTIKDIFLEELIVRRELSDNFCFYNPDYDKLSGAPAWARKTLAEHLRDRREFNYLPDQLEERRTHDRLWNAAQKEMTIRGRLGGYLRMYWAKKILEWTLSPEEAIETAVYLNNRYQLDGRDPNGYTGIMWSIAGVHDRPWPERPVFGKIRYMNYQGCRRKFNVDEYIKRIEAL
ncbi:MAG: deoxyribodipyrimidine photo-lyase [Candidatus Cloacimonetes bacterium]|nr:deoxyribodipyrimidine photo-lyase [Candidatus Cloacimonadota bacterium]